MKRGIATFTLDYGKAPPWLFERMVKLSREMIRVLVFEYGSDEFVKRIADPVWFQSLGTVLAFDWNASGLTTVLTGALKEAIKGEENDLGVFICGGKGKASRKTPSQIEGWAGVINLSKNMTDTLIKNSKMSAKVDSALVQDGYSLYHHAFFFSKPSKNSKGAWAVVQQGMNTGNKTARRYHWYDTFSSKHDFVNEPHKGIASQRFERNVLNLVAEKSSKNREVSMGLIGEGYQSMKNDIELLRKYENSLTKMLSLGFKGDEYTAINLRREDFKHHEVEFENFITNGYLDKILRKISDENPKSYEQLVATEGVGARTIRAISLVSEVIYGAKPSYEDPARYSFAHGGKDAIPYAVEKEVYDKTIETIRNAVKKTKLSPLDKDKMLRRIS